MQELPREINDRDDDRYDESPIQPSANSAGGLGGGSLLAVGVLAISISTVSSLVVLYRFGDAEQKAEMLMIVGGEAPEKKEDRYEAAIKELQNMNHVYTKQLDGLKENMSVLKADLENTADEHALRVEKVMQRLTTLERFTSDLSVKQENTLKKVAAQKVAAMTAAQAPAIPKPSVSINSVRSINGTAWVSLRAANESSPLLTLQDQWRGVKVIEVNYREGVVVISNHGVTERVSI